jgi:hypothetical protein
MLRKFPRIEAQGKTEMKVKEGVAEAKDWSNNTARPSMALAFLTDIILEGKQAQRCQNQLANIRDKKQCDFSRVAPRACPRKSPENLYLLY